MNKSQLIKVDSTRRPTFADLPATGTSGWFGLYIGYDPEIKIIGLNHVHLRLKSTNKLIRYNLQRVLKRDIGTYTVLSGSGELEPFSKKKNDWRWGPDNLAGLPITSIAPTEGIDLRAVLIAQLQIERTNVSTQSTEPPESSTEAMDIQCRVQSLLSGELDRSEAQGNLYIAPIPPPTDDDGISGDFNPVEHVVVVQGSDKIEFPDGHFVYGNTPPIFMYENENSVQSIIPEMNKAGLWGEYFKLPHPLYFGTWNEENNAIGPPTTCCPYARVGKIVDATETGDPLTTYFLVPQPLKVKDPKIATSVQITGYGNLEWNDANVSIFPPNSAFAYEGLNPGATSDDTIVDGVSLTSRKGGQTQGYKIHRYSDRQLKSGKSTRIPMPEPDVPNFLGGMPLELCTPHGISNLSLLRNGRELKGWWKDLLSAVIAVSRVIVDVGDALSKVAAEEGSYARQYATAVRAARALPANHKI
jgi:hypothetical protein